VAFIVKIPSGGCRVHCGKNIFSRSSAAEGAERLSQASGEIQSRVQWRITNLMSDVDLALAPMTSPVIFCRNVFIYFSQHATRRTVRAFADTMPSLAYLFVGMAESLMDVSSDFELREIGGGFVHIRNLIGTRTFVQL
jgi:chemotaxis methyl-accepting protein methylase